MREAWSRHQLKLLQTIIRILYSRLPLPQLRICRLNITKLHLVVSVTLPYQPLGISTLQIPSFLMVCNLVSRSTSIHVQLILHAFVYWNLQVTLLCPACSVTALFATDCKSNLKTV
jgi:hypothetical protein